MRSWLSLLVLVSVATTLLISTGEVDAFFGRFGGGFGGFGFSRSAFSSGNPCTECTTLKSCFLCGRT